MLGEFVCVLCGERFTREWNGHGGNRPRFCAKCKAEREHAAKDVYRATKREKAREARKAARAKKPAKPSKIVKRCRRCGRVFEEKRLSLTKVANASEGYVEHRYCPSCRWKQRRAAQACDPRYTAVGGHGGILEEGR